MAAATVTATLSTAASLAASSTGQREGQAEPESADAADGGKLQKDERNKFRGEFFAKLSGKRLLELVGEEEDIEKPQSKKRAKKAASTELRANQEVEVPHGRRTAHSGGAQWRCDFNYCSCSHGCSHGYCFDWLWLWLWL